MSEPRISARSALTFPLSSSAGEIFSFCFKRAIRCCSSPSRGRRAFYFHVWSTGRFKLAMARSRVARAGQEAGDVLSKVMIPGHIRSRFSTEHLSRRENQCLSW